MTNFIRALFAVALMALLAACSVDGQITDVTRRTSNPSMGEATGLISGSQQNLTTPEGYKVSSSVGAPFSAKTHTQTSEGYSVHSNVQGNINSETFDVILE